MVLDDYGYVDINKVVFNKASVSEILKCVPKLNPCTMYDGKIYPCAETAYIRHLNKKFNTDWNTTKYLNSELGIYVEKSICDFIKEILNKEFIH